MQFAIEENRLAWLTRGESAQIVQRRLGVLETAERAEESVMPQTFVSWNQIGICLPRLEALRQEFSADVNLSVHAFLKRSAFIASYQTTRFAQIVKAPIRGNGDPLVSRAGESAKVIVDVTAAAGQLRSLPAVRRRE